MIDALLLLEAETTAAIIVVVAEELLLLLDDLADSVALAVDVGTPPLEKQQE
jgi:hypothetical protein